MGDVRGVVVHVGQRTGRFVVASGAFDLDGFEHVVVSTLGPHVEAGPRVGLDVGQVGSVLGVAHGFTPGRATSAIRGQRSQL